LNPFDEERVGKEGYFRDPKFRGLCMLNENLIQHYKNAWPTHIFTFLADFTNVCLPSEKPEIAKRMVDLAAGRRIVLLCGSIEGRKNIEAFCELASVCDKSRWFFALIGDLALQSFSQKDLSALENFKLLLPEKAFIHDAFISDERDFNSIINSSDVIFAVYRNFRISSNILTKAAYFEKPILVSERFLMGERVMRFGIGRTVPEDNVSRMVAALEDFVSNLVPSENFAAYRKEFNEEKMGDALENFINRCLEKRK